MNARAHPLHSRNSGEMLADGGSTIRRSDEQSSQDSTRVQNRLERQTWTTTDIHRTFPSRPPPCYERTATRQEKTLQDETPILKYNSGDIEAVVNSFKTKTEDLVKHQSLAGSAVNFETKHGNQAPGQVGKQEVGEVRTFEQTETSKNLVTLNRDLHHLANASQVANSAVSSYQPERYSLCESDKVTSFSPPNKFSSEAVTDVGESKETHMENEEYSLLNESETVEEERPESQVADDSDSTMDSILNDVPLVLNTLAADAPSLSSSEGRVAPSIRNNDQHDFGNENMMIDIDEEYLRDIETPEQEEERSRSLEEFEQLGFEVVTDQEPLGPDCPEETI